MSKKIPSKESLFKKIYDDYTKKGLYRKLIDNPDPNVFYTPSFEKWYSASCPFKLQKISKTVIRSYYLKYHYTDDPEHNNVLKYLLDEKTYACITRDDKLNSRDLKTDSRALDDLYQQNQTLIILGII